MVNGSFWMNERCMLVPGSVGEGEKEVEREKWLPVAGCRLPVASTNSPLRESWWASREGLPLHLPSVGKAGGQAERGWGCVKLPVACCLLPVAGSERSKG